MPNFVEVSADLMASLQAAFATSAQVPARWQRTFGSQVDVPMELDQTTNACCEGFGVVAVTGLDLEPGTSQNQGIKYTRMDVAMMMFRCAPVVSDTGLAPSVAAQEAYTDLALDDADRLLNAALTVADYAWITQDDLSDPAVDTIPPEGGCGGTVVTFTMAVIEDCP